MLNILIILCFLIFESTNTFEYPKVRRDETFLETKFNIEVKDAYRWLEIPKTEERNHFIRDQNVVTRKYLDSNPYRNHIKKGLTELTNFPKHGIPTKHGSKYYYAYNSGLQNQAIIYSVNSLDDPNPKVFINPNLLSKDGTSYMHFYQFSPNNKWCTYGINVGGGDWIKYRIKNVETGEELNETLTKIKFVTPSWSDDSLGFFYSYYADYKGRADATDSGSPTNMKVYYHRINTDQSKDIKIMEFPDHPYRMTFPSVTNDGKYLHIFSFDGSSKSSWFYAHLNGKPINSSLNIIEIIKKPDYALYYVINIGNIHYMFTHKNASNGRLVAIDITDPREENWKTIIAENDKHSLQSISAVGKKYLFVEYIYDVKSRLSLHQLPDGKFLKDIDIPVGTLSGVTGSFNDSEMFFWVTSFLSPYTIYHYNFNKDPHEITIFKKSQIHGLNPEDYTVKQIFFLSKDKKVNVPMFIMHHKNITLNGDNPTLLYGYGGFDISVLPFYSAFNTFFVNSLNGIFVSVNLRGGNEYGEKWHSDGMLLNKQNVFDDFHSAAEYLIKYNYTKRERLTIHGASNGGLLVGATSIQRPDLYGCAIAQVGGRKWVLPYAFCYLLTYKMYMAEPISVLYIKYLRCNKIYSFNSVMDMLRFHKFTVGYAWIPEYGSPDEEIYFKNLIKYSPLHNIPSHATEYPAMLITTADHDDRVAPLHSFKFASQLQYSLGTILRDTPLMIRIDTNAGHGGGKSTAKVIDEYTDIMSFIINSLKLKNISFW